MLQRIDVDSWSLIIEHVFPCDYLHLVLTCKALHDRLLVNASNFLHTSLYKCAVYYEMVRLQQFAPFKQKQRQRIRDLRLHLSKLQKQQQQHRRCFSKPQVAAQQFAVACKNSNIIFHAQSRLFYPYEAQYVRCLYDGCRLLANFKNTENAMEKRVVTAFLHFVDKLKQLIIRNPPKDLIQLEKSGIERHVAYLIEHIQILKDDALWLSYLITVCVYMVNETLLQQVIAKMKQLDVHVDTFSSNYFMLSDKNDNMVQVLQKNHVFKIAHVDVACKYLYAHKKLLGHSSTLGAYWKNRIGIAITPYLICCLFQNDKLMSISDLTWHLDNLHANSRVAEYIPDLKRTMIHEFIDTYAYSKDSIMEHVELFLSRAGKEEYPEKYVFP